METQTRRIKLTVAYDGTEYCGWQAQPNGITVEEVLNKALSSALKEDITVIGASRTDSGVHARGNVAVFDTHGRIPAEKIAYAVNQWLPDDVVVTESVEVSREFHPRYRKTRKTYEYVIYNGTHPDPLRRRYTYFNYHKMNVDLMREGAAYLVGRHDFASFCCARAEVASTVRTIDSIDVFKTGCEITIRISGDGFLYNMVRMIAGVLMRVGGGYYPPSEVEKILNECQKGYARPTAPACGLTLMSIEYPEVRCDWAVREIDIAYHDREWGVPVHDDRKLFEVLILEGQQSGLSWNTILNKRSALRKAYSDFDPEKVSRYNRDDVDRLMNDAGIIRNRRKIEAAISNAQAFLDIQARYGSFDEYIWKYVDGDPIVNHWETLSEIPASTPLSEEISKDLKKRGFKFVGPTIVYSFMQAVGMVNDHLEGCFRHGEIRDYYEKYDK